LISALSSDDLKGIIAQRLPLGVDKSSSTSYTPFSGVFEGHGHVVKNLVMNKDRSGFFFGLNGATVKNLVFHSTCKFSGVTNYDDLVGVVALNAKGTVIIDNVTVSAEIEGYQASGFVTEAQDSITITNSKFDGHFHLQD